MNIYWLECCYYGSFAYLHISYNNQVNRKKGKLNKNQQTTQIQKVAPFHIRGTI